MPSPLALAPAHGKTCRRTSIPLPWTRHVVAALCLGVTQQPSCIGHGEESWTYFLGSWQQYRVGKQALHSRSIHPCYHVDQRSSTKAKEWFKTTHLEEQLYNSVQFLGLLWGVHEGRSALKSAFPCELFSLSSLFYFSIAFSSFFFFFFFLLHFRCNQTPFTTLPYHAGIWS